MTTEIYDLDPQRANEEAQRIYDDMVAKYGKPA